MTEIKQLEERINNLDDFIKGLYTVIDTLIGKGSDNIVERIEKLENPINEQRERIANISPQILELANHDLDLRNRIEKLEETVKELQAKLQPTGFKEHKASGWEGLTRNPKGVEDRRGYTGW